MTVRRGQGSRAEGDHRASESADGLASLREALQDWVERGRLQELTRWLRQEIGEDGVPRRLPVEAWSSCLGLLAEARRQRPGAWPGQHEARLRNLLRVVLRFTRADGSPLFATEAVRTDARGALRAWADWLDPAAGAVLSGWSAPGSRTASRRRATAPPPSPAFAASGVPLAMLRTDWSPHGDLIAIDQRDEAARLELRGAGIPWLGPQWGEAAGRSPSARARLTGWSSDAQADWAEWSFRSQGNRITRSAVLLRGRPIAVLGEQVAGDAAPSALLRIALAPDVAAVPLPDSQAIRLTAGRGRTATLVPLSLPCRPDPVSPTSDRFTVEDRQLVLRPDRPGRRVWMPLLITWGPRRPLASPRWWTLTVAERFRVCPPEVAVAARIAWGPQESLVVYRSLARPALRSFLGHQTRARFLVGLFTTGGDIQTLLQVDG